MAGPPCDAGSPLKSPTRARVAINLALQGGGAHGAFTWGVLDRLLDEDWIEVAAISGTSAGALNGAAFKAGWHIDGRAGARAVLDALWSRVGRLGDLRMTAWMQPFWAMGRIWDEALEAVMPVSAQGIAAQVVSPYAWGGAWQNPLAPVVADFDFTAVCAGDGPRLFVGATNVRTGRARIFTGTDLSPDALLASACLPTVFQAVEIDGEHYWDGGYSGNPALWPLYEAGLPDDVLIVQINPIRRDALPLSPLDIQNRINEISFNAALLGELRAINFVKRLIAEGRMERGRMKDVRLHMIADDAVMTGLSATSKLSPSPWLVLHLKEAGHMAADAFLSAHADRLGQDATLDLARLFA